MYIVILSFLGIAIFGLWIKVRVEEKSNDSTAFGLMLLFMLYIAFLISLLYHNTRTPLAMDVYQGKTELKYTAQWGEITDFMAVYKN